MPTRSIEDGFTCTQASDLAEVRRVCAGEKEEVCGDVCMAAGEYCDAGL
jgi:hypothetical protein